MRSEEYDLTVVGGGAAGMWAALKAADQGASAALVSSTPLVGSASNWAQGGLAAAVGNGDSTEGHYQDTLLAGRGASRESAVRVLCDEAPLVVAELLERRFDFDVDDDGLPELGLEGGHTHRRILHSGGSATGKMISNRLLELVTECPSIRLFEGESVTNLWLNGSGECIGAITGSQLFKSPATVLATGGAASLWSRSTNPPSALGSGLTLAYEAGATLADLELVQFHPTALKRPGGGKFDGFLISEAVRGEGALLIDAAGQQFVDELAPRDVVARAVLERTGTNGSCTFLDMREVDISRFPNLVEVLEDSGLRPGDEPVPVAPAAHYMMGGIATDLEGRTTVPGLFAVGECACTGLHGANRLASNSLTECFVFGSRAARAALQQPPPSGQADDPPAGKPLTSVTEKDRTDLWTYAGLVRNDAGLTRLSGTRHPIARLIGLSGIAREESRGAHYRSDFSRQERRFEGQHVVVKPGDLVSTERWS